MPSKLRKTNLLFLLLTVFVPALLIRCIWGILISDQPYFQKYISLAIQFQEGSRDAPFSSSPVYMFFISGFLSLFGHHILLLRTLHLLLGAISAFLTAWIGYRTFGLRAGMIAGLLFSIHGPGLVYEGDFVTSSVMTLLNICACLAFLYALSNKNKWMWLLTGCLVGLSAGVRPTLLILSVLIVFVNLFLYHSFREKFYSLIVFAAGTCIAVLPIALLNYYLSGELILITSSGGSVFYSSNNFRSTGLGYSPPLSLTEIENTIMRQGNTGFPVEHMIFKFLAERAAGKPLTYRQVSAFYYDEAYMFLKKDMTRSLMSLLKKGFYYINNYEVLDTASLVQLNAIRRDVFPFLPGFGFLFVIGTCGIFFSQRKSRQANLLLLFLVPHVLTAFLFYVNGRLRAPIVPFLSIYAGFFISVFLQDLRTLHYRAYISICLILGVSAITFSEDKIIRQHRTVQTPAFLHSIKGLAAIEAGNISLAEKELLTAVKIDPLGAREAHANLSIIYRQKGIFEEAEKEMKRSSGNWSSEALHALINNQELDPYSLDMALANAFWHEGDREKAMQIFRRVHQQYPFHPDPVYNLAVAEYGGRPAECNRLISNLDRALELGMKLELASTRAYKLKLKCLEVMGDKNQIDKVQQQIAWEESLNPFN